MPVRFERIEIEKERELENLIIKVPDQVEKGLVFLTHQQQVSGGFIDVLCADKDGVFVIIELKISDDEGILFQALHYYDYVSLNKAAIANQFISKVKFNLNEEPRIILIAPSFSERVKKASKYISAPLKLVEFVHLKTASGEKGIFFNEIAVDTDEGYTPPQPVERVIDYIHSPKIREICKTVIESIRAQCKEIDEPKTAGSTGIRFRFKNRKIADIWVKHSFFWFACFLGRAKWEKIERQRDWTKIKPRVMKDICKLYEQLGGE